MDYESVVKFALWSENHIRSVRAPVLGGVYMDEAVKLKNVVPVFKYKTSGSGGETPHILNLGTRSR
jgi:hypothetical protein